MKRVHLDLAKKISSSEYLRGLLPYRYCWRQLKEEGIQLTFTPGRGIQEGERLDGIYCRFILPSELLVHLLDRRWSHGMRLGYDQDDLLLSIPESNGLVLGNREKESIKLTAREADLFVGSTSQLVAQFNRDSGRCAALKKFAVAPNLLDLNDWGWVSPSGTIGYSHPQDTEQCRIAVAGTNTHDLDWAITGDALVRICKDHPHVLIMVMGDAHPSWIAECYPQIREVPFVDFAAYPEALRKLRAHIGLCPLISSRFNASKSSIKWSEYTAAGMAVIASRSSDSELDQTPYESLPEEVVLLTENDADSWFSAIDLFVKSNSERNQLWIRAAQHLVDNLSWQRKKNHEPWLDVFRFLGGC